jgi:flagellar basal-body rod protein FlgB
MDPVSALLINKALDGLSMRAIATSQNIANANSPNYRPLRVTFEEALRSAATHGGDAIRSVEPSIKHVETTAAGKEMRLDLELATASETAMRYSALIDLLGRQMQISQIAMRGGQ